MDIARSSLKLFVANAVGAAVVFVGIAYFARKLGRAPLGVFFLFQALLRMFSLLADFGLRRATEKRLSEGESKGKFLTSSLVLKSGLLSVFVIGILIFRGPINEYLGAKIGIFLAIAIVLQEFAQLSVFVLKGELRVGETASLRLIRQVVWIGTSAVLVSRGFGARGLVYGLMAGLIVMAVLGWYKCSIPLNRPSQEQFRSLFDYGKYNIVSSIGGYAYSWTDVVIIGLFLTQSHVASYEVAWRVTMVVLLLSHAIAESVFPQVSQWDTEGSIDQIESVIQEALIPALGLIIPSVFGVMVLAREILGLVFGAEFTGAWLVLIVLMGEKLFQATHQLIGRSLIAINRPDLAAYATIIAVIFNVVLNVSLVVTFGIEGVAVATAVSFALNTTLHGYYLSRFVVIRIPVLELGWCTLSAAGMAITLSLVRSVVPVDNLPLLLAMIGGGATVYTVLVLSYRPLRSKIFEQIRVIHG